ncbi:MAG: DNRLRE domain-containing protein, partial [Myxococcales bacterium]|nr:DNRLRE domain-containing protein [Myxococcales bacterium]
MRGRSKLPALVAGAMVAIVAACAGPASDDEGERVGTASEALQTSLAAAADTYVDEDHPHRASGGASTLLVEGDGESHVLVRFDLASAAGSLSRVDSATLVLTVLGGARRCGGHGQPLAVHRMRRGWTEAGATYRCPDDAVPTNGSYECPAGGWDMDPRRPSDAPWVTPPTDVEVVHDGRAGTVRFDVTADVRAFV